MEAELQTASGALQGGEADLRSLRLHKMRERKELAALQLDNTHRLLAGVLDDLEDLNGRR